MSDKIIASGPTAGVIPNKGFTKAAFWVVLAVVGIIAIIWIATAIRSSGVKPANLFKSPHDLVETEPGSGVYVERGRPAGTNTNAPTSANWIPAEVREIPFHPVPGAIPRQMMGKIQVPGGSETLLFEGLTPEWKMDLWYHTTASRLVFEKTYNGAIRVGATAGVARVSTTPPHLDQIWSISVFVPTNQSSTDLTVEWRLSRK